MSRVQSSMSMAAQLKFKLDNTQSHVIDRDLSLVAGVHVSRGLCAWCS